MAHHQLIRLLIAELRTTRDQLEQANNAAYWSSESHARELNRARERTREAQEQAEQERYDRECIIDAERKAERARSFGNDWEANRIIEQARRWHG